MCRRARWLAVSVALFWCVACGDEAAQEPDFGTNPFLESQTNYSKEDTEYVNPDGIEVEVDIEADIEAPAWKIKDGPAMLGQYALTYLRKRGDFYLESLAEDATSKERVEWRIDGEWLTAAQVEGTDPAKLTHFRIRGINAVLLHGKVNDAIEGKQFIAKVPIAPYDVMARAGDKCADKDGHITLSQSVYWYMWNPNRNGCDATLVQDMLVTVSRLLPSSEVTWPEYDLLVEDKKITAVVLFGKIGDDDIESDIGMWGFKRMGTWLKDAGFHEVADAPVGKRYAKQILDVLYEIDLYSPHDFSGLSDSGNYKNFERAIVEHEIVVYDGHSMLGASDFWAKPTYPDFYQIFIYGGCLGYEYYVTPILKGKGGWDKVDIVSSVIEVSVGANDFAGPFLAKLAWAIEHNYNASWKDMLVAIRQRVGDSTFGVCGARSNCFSPAGSLCGTEPVDGGDTQRHEATGPMAIPDNEAAGITSTLTVEQAGIVQTASLELDIAHTYVGDLRIVLSHAGIERVLWENAGGMAQDIRQTFVLTDFAGTDAAGDWTLTVADTWQQDEGQLNFWALEITTLAP